MNRITWTMLVVVLMSSLIAILNIALDVDIISAIAYTFIATALFAHFVAPRFFPTLKQTRNNSASQSTVNNVAEINPTTGLPMVGATDINGNLYGMNTKDDSTDTRTDY